MTSFDIESLPPVLTIELPAMFKWEPNLPGGCRCACAIAHRSQMRPACTNPAEPGMLLRVQTPTGTSRPLPICLGCYHDLVPLSV